MFLEALQQQYNSEVQQIQQERQQYMDALQNIITSSAEGMSQYADTDWDALRSWPSGAGWKERM